MTKTTILAVLLIAFVALFVQSAHSLTCQQMGGEHCVAIGCNEHCQFLGKSGGGCQYVQGHGCICYCFGMEKVPASDVEKEVLTSVVTKKKQNRNKDDAEL